MRRIRCDICGAEREDVPVYGGQPFREVNYEYFADVHPKKMDICPLCFEEFQTIVQGQLKELIERKKNENQ